MKKLLWLMAWIVILGIGAHLPSSEARYPVIIDMDCGFDDLRAILMFLANHEFEVLALTTSEGSLTPAEGLRKVRSLLETLHHEGIPVAAGRKLDIPPPPWRSFCQGLSWGEESSSHPADSSSAVELISSILKSERGKVRLVCLGSLTTASDLLGKHQELGRRLERIVWYNDAGVASQGFNYETDREAAAKMFKLGVDIDIVGAGAANGLGFDFRILGELAKLKTPYAGVLADSYKAGKIQGQPVAGHQILRDDLVPLFMLSSGLFNSEQDGHISMHSLKDESAGRQALQMILTILSDRGEPEGQVFSRFPDDPSLFSADIRPYIPEILARHGQSEWRAGVITCELHGHLGIYSIIGVKMGLRAREYFNIGVDDLAILSLAGLKPPVSCLNDGLQAGTGGTLGHGLITVSDEPLPKPEAIFTFKNRKIRVSLKKETAEMVAAVLANAVERYGNLTDSYWDYVREQAIRFWRELDRHEIFVIEKIGP
ncbi:MAG: nucleoside hydrolase [Acidobacteriota bacterium]